MSTPVKAASLLSKAKFLSPKSPKYFSTPKSKSEEKSDYLLKVPTEKIKRKLGGDNLEDSVSIDSPHKSKLLNFGLNKYDLVYTLGRGSFGTVVKGHHKGNLVAVKLIKSNSNKIKEFNALGLVHKNLIQILEIVTSTNHSLIIMEYLSDSKNLQAVLNETKLAKCYVVKFTNDISCGLNYCHENNVLHLDIKPKNILVCDGVCKICDFGNSVKILGEQSDSLDHCGTVAYTAPEIFTSRKASNKSDVYSLGVLIWQMFTGKQPYESMNKEVVIYRVVKFDFRPVLDEVGDLQFKNLCCRCWDRDPEQRPTAAEIYNVLCDI